MDRSGIDARSEENLVCFVEDDFNSEKPRWCAILSDSRTVLADDHRPGLEPYSAWSRLKNYLEKTNLFIHCLYLQFRSHTVDPFPRNAAAYYFAHSAAATWGGPTIGGFNIGYLDDFIGENFCIHKYSVPELNLLETEIRHVQNCSENFIIWHVGKKEN